MPIRVTCLLTAVDAAQRDGLWTPATLIVDTDPCVGLNTFEHVWTHTIRHGKSQWKHRLHHPFLSNSKQNRPRCSKKRDSERWTHASLLFTLFLVFCFNTGRRPGSASVVPCKIVWHSLPCRRSRGRCRLPNCSTTSSALHHAALDRLPGTEARALRARHFPQARDEASRTESGYQLLVPSESLES